MEMKYKLLYANILIFILKSCWRSIIHFFMKPGNFTAKYHNEALLFLLSIGLIINLLYFINNLSKRDLFWTMSILAILYFSFLVFFMYLFLFEKYNL